MIICKANKVEKRPDGRYDIHFDLFGTLWYGGPGAPQNDYFVFRGDGTDVYCYPSSEEHYLELLRKLEATQPAAAPQPKQSSEDTVGILSTKRLILEKLGQVADLRSQIILLAGHLPEDQRDKLQASLDSLGDAVTQFFADFTES